MPGDTNEDIVLFHSYLSDDPLPHCELFCKFLFSPIFFFYWGIETSLWTELHSQLFFIWRQSFSESLNWPGWAWTCDPPAFPPSLRKRSARAPTDAPTQQCDDLTSAVWAKPSLPTGHWFYCSLAEQISPSALCLPLLDHCQIIQTYIIFAIKKQNDPVPQDLTLFFLFANNMKIFSVLNHCLIFSFLVSSVRLVIISSSLNSVAHACFALCSWPSCIPVPCCPGFMWLLGPCFALLWPLWSAA